MVYLWKNSWNQSSQNIHLQGLHKVPCNAVLSEANLRPNWNVNTQLGLWCRYNDDKLCLGSTIWEFVGFWHCVLCKTKFWPRRFFWCHGHHSKVEMMPKLCLIQIKISRQSWQHCINNVFNVWLEYSERFSS